MAFVAGHYTATWSGTSIGTSRDGFRLKEVFRDQPIIVDEGGEAPVDALQMGVEVEVTLTYVEYASIKAALYAQAGTQGNSMANVGVLLSTLAKALVLTASGGSATGTYTFSRAIVVSDIETLLGSGLRSGPCTFRCYPAYSGSGGSAGGVIYTTT